MREVASHWPGRIFLLVLALSTIAVIYLVASGFLEQQVVVAGWITLPLLVGAVYVVVWLLAYLVYFFGFWPYR